MAYSNTKKPALYIPIFDYLQSIGNIEYADGDLNDIHLLNPTKTHRMELDTTFDTVQDVELNSEIEYDDIADADGNIYLFILGHNLYSAGSAISIQLIKDDDSTADATYTSVVNYNGDTSAPAYNGFSIVELSYTQVTKIKGFKILFKNLGDSSSSAKIGCVSLCSKYTFPHSPDLALKMTREYDGVKTIETKGGATLSNAQYTRGGTHWASNYAWQLEYADFNQTTPSNTGYTGQTRTLGRRNWSLKFSYLSDSDIMPETESLEFYETEYTSNVGITLRKSNSFFARVLNRVQGSHLPFIFQPDSSNANPDQWALARLDQNEISINQVAHTVYDLSLKIREVW